MKLYLNDTSPFSRVVVCMALLTKIKDIELIWVDPWSTPENLIKVNPFSTIPALALNDDTIVTESLCICDYLLDTAQQSSNNNNICKGNISLLGSGKTLMEIAFRTTAINRFCGQENELVNRGNAAISRSLNYLEAMIINNSAYNLDSNDFASLYAIVALEYVTFRHSEIFKLQSLRGLEFKIKSSPHRRVLDVISLDCLATKPSYDFLYHKLY